VTILKEREIDRMFEEMGLAREEEREPFRKMARDLGGFGKEKEQIFIRLDINTPSKEE